MSWLLRGLARRFPGLTRQWRYAKYNLRDIYDAYVAAAIPPVLTPLGFKFGGLPSQHHAAMMAGRFEPAEVRVLSSLLPHLDVFVDVGANAGYFTCLARMFNKKVVAIEPMPKNLEVLFGNLRANGWTDTEIFPLGVSDKVGIQTLYGASSTGASLIDNWAGAPSSFRRTICVSTLDSLFAGRFDGLRMLIKMDVEGWEYQALMGAGALLARPVKPIWLVEVTFHEYHPGGHNPRFGDIFRRFFASNYKALLLAEEELIAVTAQDVVRWEAAGRTDSLFVNYLFVPLGSSDEDLIINRRVAPQTAA